MAKVPHPTAKNHRHHLIINYVLLFFIFLTGGLALVLLNDKTLQYTIVAALAAVYLIWGLWHHHEHQTLTKEVALEYAGVAGIIVMIFLLVA